MASTKAAAIASPQIFTSDPMEQIFAKGLDNPEFSGYAYGFLNAARGDRARAQSTYMQGLDASNKMASRLAQQEMQQEMLREALKQGPEYAKAGLPINQVQLISQLFNQGGNDQQTMDASALVNELKRSQIAENAAKAAGVGKGNADQFELDIDQSTSGTGASTWKGKTKGDPAELRKKLLYLHNEDRKARGLPPVAQGQELSRPSKETEREQMQKRAESDRRILR